MRSWVHRRRARGAVRGEKAAAQLLEREGYAVVDSQVALEWDIEVDGQTETISLRADHLVERGSRRYIAEVKTGHQAPSIANAAPRRQVRE